jgi:hypothetical protein
VAKLELLEISRNDRPVCGAPRPPRGVTLARLRARLGSKLGGEMQDPETGSPVHVDLSPWADHDPGTLIQLRWHWENKESLAAITGAASTGGQDAVDSVRGTIHHLIRDHNIAPSQVSRAVEAQHDACHRGQ